VPQVNPGILVWARESAGLDPDEAARKLGIKEGTLRTLESGDAEPSRAQLVKMASCYRRPLVSFYLPAPPPTAPRGEDFRTLSSASSDDEERTRQEAVLDTLLRGIIARQNLLRAAIEDEEERGPLPFVGSVTMDAGVAVVVASIQRTLSFTAADYQRAASPSEAFRLLRQAAERAGVFVLLLSDLGSHHTALDLSTFRGFALADPIAPFVIINDQDSRAAWSFTLLHELAHVWLGYTGVSNASLARTVERFCNQVAAEFLVPAGEFRRLDVGTSTEPGELAVRVTEFARARNVSRSMVAVGLYLNGKLSASQLRELTSTFQAEWAARPANRTGSGPDYWVVRRQRLGDALIELTARLMEAGALTTAKAGRVLGVKPFQVQRLTSPPIRRKRR
jgi:Zn-dependent peptidase ImmA (M78 family)/transcriptional regulator with XRE-family HTH domain